MDEARIKRNRITLGITIASGVVGAITLSILNLSVAESGLALLLFVSILAIPPLYYVASTPWRKALWVAPIWVALAHAPLPLGVWYFNRDGKNRGSGHMALPDDFLEVLFFALLWVFVSVIVIPIVLGKKYSFREVIIYLVLGYLTFRWITERSFG